MRICGLVTLLFSGLLLAATVEGSSCGTATAYHATGYATYGHATGYATYGHYQTYQPTVFLPLYSLGAYGTTPETLSVLEEIKKLRQDHNEALKQIAAISGQRLGMANEPPFVSVLRANCASCHSAPSAKAGFALFTGGQVSDLSPEQVTALITRISLPKGDPKKMPPSGELSYSDFAQVINGIAANPKK